MVYTEGDSRGREERTLTKNNEELELFRRLDEIEKSDPELYAEVVLGAKKGVIEQKSRCRCEG